MRLVKETSNDPSAYLKPKLLLYVNLITFMSFLSSICMHFVVRPTSPELVPINKQLLELRLLSLCKIILKLF